MRRIGTDSFEYWVYRPKSKEYRHCDWMLKAFSTEQNKRRWLIIWK